MKIGIQSVADRGNPDKERLILKVRSDAGIGDYVLIQSGFHDDSVTTETYNTYWFPYKKVEADDLVVLYTKSSRENEKELTNGKHAHFFYWGLSKPVWSGSDRAPVLFHAPEWISKEPDEL